MALRSSLVVVLGVLVYSGLAGRANATPTSPPPDYPYTIRQPMVASNTITFSDPILQQSGYYHGQISSDADGTAITIRSHLFDLPFFFPNSDLDYYFRYPFQTADGTPDLTLVDFDLKDPNGELAGFEESFTWSSGDQTWYYLYKEINGEAHYMMFSADANGNVDDSTVTQVRHTKKRPDRCKIVADWGALGCPRDFHGIQEIPTQVRSFLTQAGWFDGWGSAIWDKLTRAANAVGTFLEDPRVKLALEGIVIVGGIAICCLPAAATLPVCVGCLVTAAAGTALALGNYSSAIDSGVPTITNSPGLRAAGILSCSGSGCQSNCGVLSWSGPPAIMCSYKVPTDGSCAAPYSMLPPVPAPNPQTCAYIQTIQ